VRRKRLIQPVEVDDFGGRAEGVIEIDKELSVGHAHLEAAEIIGLLNRPIYRGELFEAILHAAEWNELDTFAHKLAAEVITEFAVVEGGDLLA
jgi:hypothetical protein